MLSDSVTRGTKVGMVTAGPATIALGLLVTWSVISDTDLFDKVKRGGMMPFNKMCMHPTRIGRSETAETGAHTSEERRRAAGFRSVDAWRDLRLVLFLQRFSIIFQ